MLIVKAITVRQEIKQYYACKVHVPYNSTVHNYSTVVHISLSNDKVVKCLQYTMLLDFELQMCAV